MKWENKRVFISGGAGVIGTSLVDKLYKMGAIIYVGDLKPRPGNWPAAIRYRQGDLNYIVQNELNYFSPEYFFHLAAAFECSVETYDFWDKNFHNNLKLSHHLMSCLKDSSSLKKVVFASSYLIYNPALYLFDQPVENPIRITELDAVYPRNLTGAAKLFHEIELNFISSFEKVRFEIVCARIYRSYGKNSKDVISRWIRELLMNETLTVFCKGGFFDYIYAEEAAEGLIKLAEAAAAGIVNLGNDNARRVEDILNILKKYFPEMTTKEIDVNMPYEASRANMDYFKTITGWMPDKQLEDSIPEIIEFEKDATRNKQNRSPMDVNILVTSISKKVPLITSLKKANLKIGNTGKIFGSDTDENCIGKYFVDLFWKIPKLTELKIGEFLDYCRENQITCLIPTRDGDLDFFARHKELLHQNGIVPMVSDYSAVQICLDKLVFYDRCRSMGFPVINTVQNITELDCIYYVVKERYGSGSRNIGLKLTKEQAIAKSALLQTHVFQPYIDGSEVSVDVYIDLKGKTKGVIVRERSLIVNGESQITVTIREKKLEEMSAALAERLKLYGHIIFQVLIGNEGSFHIIECNCRFGGASTLSLESGLDSFYWFLLESTGSSLEDYTFCRSTFEKKLVRYPYDLIV